MSNSKKTKTDENETTGKENKSAELDTGGFPFPYSIRETGASVELLRLEDVKPSEIESWSKENLYGNASSEDEADRWGIIASAKGKAQRQDAESMFLSLAFRRIVRSSLKLVGGNIHRVEEETIEPEIDEFHLRTSQGILELYSPGAKQRTALLKSLRSAFGEESAVELFLTKDAMKSLMTEAIEVTSVSLTGLGNPFFGDASLTGTDPTNSKTYKELLGSGEIKSFWAKFQPASSREDASISPLVMGVSASKCKVRFYGGQTPVAQSDIEDYTERIANIASASERASKKEVGGKEALLR